MEFTQIDDLVIKNDTKEKVRKYSFKMNFKILFKFSNINIKIIIKNKNKIEKIKYIIKIIN